MTCGVLCLDMQMGKQSFISRMRSLSWCPILQSSSQSHRVVLWWPWNSKRGITRSKVLRIGETFGRTVKDLLGTSNQEQTSGASATLHGARTLPQTSISQTSSQTWTWSTTREAVSPLTQQKKCSVVGFSGRTRILRPTRIEACSCRFRACNFRALDSRNAAGQRAFRFIPRNTTRLTRTFFQTVGASQTSYTLSTLRLSPFDRCKTCRSPSTFASIGTFTRRLISTETPLLA